MQIINHTYIPGFLHPCCNLVVFKWISPSIYIVTHIWRYPIFHHSLSHFPSDFWHPKYMWKWNLCIIPYTMVFESFRSGMWFWKTIPESKAPTKGMCLFEEIQSKSPQKQLFLKGKIPKGMWFWKNHFWKHNPGMESCFVRALNPPQAKAMVFEEI